VVKLQSERQRGAFQRGVGMRLQAKFGKKRSLSRRAMLAGGAVAAACLATGTVGCTVTESRSGIGAGKAEKLQSMREFVLTIWGMKPYSLPQGETAPAITPDGKWQHLPIGPEGAVMASVHHFVPHTFTVNKGDTVRLTVMNLGLHYHGFAIPDYDIDFLAGGRNIVGERGPSSGPIGGTVTGGPQARTVTFVADRPGIVDFMCNLPYDKERQYCNPLHPMIQGQLIVLGA
jgi:FtsP/CotA-like multicopper oxidase with cupredoxin domain